MVRGYIDGCRNQQEQENHHWGEKKILDFIGFPSSLGDPSKTANNRIGYVINATKNKTEEAQ